MDMLRLILCLSYFTISQIHANAPFGVQNFNGIQSGQSSSGSSPFIQNQPIFPPQLSWLDQRAMDDHWTPLYPFGEGHFDSALIDQPNHDTQIDLNFYFPFYGFRFNYTFILPNGIVAFSLPEWIQPPYEFPNPKWPERPDASFIAPFFAHASFQYVGDQKISSVWFRTVHRPNSDTGDMDAVLKGNGQFGQNAPLGNLMNGDLTGVRKQMGYVEDSGLLDKITHDIQEGINGANGFRAVHALLVTWDRMAYGGAAREINPANFDEAKKWQNTYQLVLATDEIRSYVLFNYGHINWTSSSEAGNRGRGRGGFQSAIAGFNGGNGTGFTAMPYSGEGEIYKLAKLSSVSVPGRWVFRVDEEIIYGGCSNASSGIMTVSPNRATMLGGLVVNVSGPCFRPTDTIVVLLDEFLISCTQLNMHRARCMLPKFHKVGLINTRISKDGGASFPYVGVFYIVPHDRATPGVTLRRDVYDYSSNAFDHYDPHELTITWSRLNLTNNPNSRVTLDIWGYWEDTEKHVFEKVGVITEDAPNTGAYTFQPQLLTRPSDPSLQDKWRTSEIGVIRISVTDDETVGVLYSPITPLAFYFRPYWQEEYGEEWALQRCVEWFEWDGQWRNYWMDIDACPCTLDQALLDIGRFMPYLECDKDGDGGCYYHRGAQHCIMSAHATWTGAQTVCCYDLEGWLMHSDDYEGLDVLKYYSPGVPYRAHTFGSYPYKVPPYIPTFSNWIHDIGPYHMCCRWARHCEFLFWRRPTHGCQGYLPPAAGYAYGHSHFITFDGVHYTFNGKGYFVLAMSDHPSNKLMIQVRMEQPARNSYGVVPNVTVITGVAICENNSDIVEVLARKEHKRWRYRMDVMVKGIARFFDTPDMKVQQFKGFNIWSPSRNFDQSVIHIQLRSGVGVRVEEFNGMLDVLVTLPSSYDIAQKQELYEQIENSQDTNDFRNYYQTYGLLGLYNNDPKDDFVSVESTVPINLPAPPGQDPVSRRMLYYEFGQKWRVDGNNRLIGPILFQPNNKPINNPHLFSDINYEPSFDQRHIPFNITPILSNPAIMETCQSHFPCQHDFIATGMKEIALETMRKENLFNHLRDKGSVKLISCGAIYKSHGIRKNPPGNNYLDGVTVTMDCRPEYFMHGTTQRTCVNGSWTPGWHAWCRLRTEEFVLRWVSGIGATVLIIVLTGAIFGYCYYRNIRVSSRRKSLIKIPFYRTSSTTLLGTRNHLHPARRGAVTQRQNILRSVLQESTGITSISSSESASPVSSLVNNGRKDSVQSKWPVVGNGVWDIGRKMSGESLQNLSVDTAGTMEPLPVGLKHVNVQDGNTGYHRSAVDLIQNLSREPRNRWAHSTMRSKSVATVPSLVQQAIQEQSARTLGMQFTCLEIDDDHPVNCCSVENMQRCPAKEGHDCDTSGQGSDCCALSTNSCPVYYHGDQCDPRVGERCTSVNMKHDAILLAELDREPSQRKPQGPVTSDV